MTITWAVILTAVSAILLIANVSEKIVQAVKAARAPGKEQNDRLSALEGWRKEVDAKLAGDRARFERLEQSNRVTQRAHFGTAGSQHRRQ